MSQSISFRTPMRVCVVRAFRSDTGITCYPVCPRCQLSMEREHQLYCDRCGQALDWREFRKAIVCISK